MTKKELIEALAAKNEGMTKKAVEDFVGSVFDTMTEALKAGEKVAWPGFGAFTVKDLAARKGRNPATGEEIDIAARRNVKFKASQGLKDAV